MRLAVIDCGTNTFNLLVMELLQNGTYERLFNTRVSVKLGQGSINKGIISEEALERAHAAIQVFDSHIRKLQVTKTLAYATSAIREASNGKQFVDRIKQEFHIDLEVIDGDQEAYLIYLGVKAALPLAEQVSLIMDIGGGSTEFILANNKGILWKHSFKIGAARLLERFAPSDPITLKEIESIHWFLQENTIELFRAVKTFGPVELVGSSGAFDSLIEMIHGEYKGEDLVNEKTEYLINQIHYQNIKNKVIASTLEERKKIKGLVPMRFDMIVISCLMIDFILKNFHLSTLRVSTFSLKEGALVDYIQHSNNNIN